MKFRLDVFIILLLAIAVIAWAAGTVTDYVTFTPGAVPGAPAEGMMYWHDVNNNYGIYDAANWFWFGPEVFQFKPVAAPFADVEGGTYYDSDTDQLFVRTGAATYEELNGSTLDNTYDQGATITVDAGTITFNNTEVDGQDTLTIANSGAAGTGQALDITDTKTGAHQTILLDITSGSALSGGLHIRDNAANTANLAYGIKIESVDATTEIVNGILFTVATNAMMTDAIDCSDPEITNCLNAGPNVAITGTTCSIDTSNWDADSAGDWHFQETGGNSADPDFEVDGYALIGVTDGCALGDATNRVNFSDDGVITFSANARPTIREWHSVQDLDLGPAGGDGTDPVENEAGSTAKYSIWSFSEGSTIAYYQWLIPQEVDVSAAINIYIAWTTENGGGDSCLWRVRHDGGKTFNNDEVPTAPSTVLDTPIADDTTDVQYEEALTAAGVINGATFTDGELVTFDFYLTDCDAGGAPDIADMIGFIIEYRYDSW